MSEDLTTRPAGADDRPAIASLLAAAAGPHGSGRPAGPHRPVHSDVLLFRRPGGPDHG